MAFTVTVVDKTVYGNKKVHFLKVTADSAEGTIDTGLSRITQFSYGPQSMVTAAGKFFINVGSTSTAANGFIGISSIVNGDVFFITVHGV